MKLYIWNDPYCVSYGGSFIYAVAETLPEAMKQVALGKLYNFGQYKGTTPKVVLAKTTRILKLPCAEWFEYSE